MRLGRLFDIPIFAHWTWFIGLGYLALDLLGSGGAILPTTLNPGERLVMAVLLAVSVFGSILVHELAHSLVAKRLGYFVDSITLFLFGGVSMISGERRRAAHEFMIAGIGPVSSLAIGLVALWLYNRGDPAFGSVTISTWLRYLAFVNIAVAAFNMLPGLPLDGGRVAQSIIWTVLGNRDQSTRIAAYMGRVVAIGLGCLALYFFLRLGVVGPALWTLLVAGFLWLGATGELRAAGGGRPRQEPRDEGDGGGGGGSGFWRPPGRPDDGVRGRSGDADRANVSWNIWPRRGRGGFGGSAAVGTGATVRDLLTPTPMALDAEMSLDDGLRFYDAVKPHQELPVLARGSVGGFVTMSELRNARAAPGSSGIVRVGVVMRSYRTEMVGADMAASAALQLLARGVQRLVVFDGNRILGTIAGDGSGRGGV